MAVGILGLRDSRHWVSSPLVWVHGSQENGLGLVEKGTGEHFEQLENGLGPDGS